MGYNLYEQNNSSMRLYGKNESVNTLLENSNI